jgi:hypothetical protein
VDAITKMITAIAAIYDTKLTHQPWDVAGLPWLKIGSIIGGRGEIYDLRSVSRNVDLCTLTPLVRGQARRAASSCGSLHAGSF